MKKIPDMIDPPDIPENVLISYMNKAYREMTSFMGIPILKLKPPNRTTTYSELAAESRMRYFKMKKDQQTTLQHERG